MGAHTGVCRLGDIAEINFLGTLWPIHGFPFVVFFPGRRRLPVVPPGAPPVPGGFFCSLAIAARLLPCRKVGYRTDTKLMVGLRSATDGYPLAAA